MKLFTKKLTAYLSRTQRVSDWGDVNDPPGTTFLNEVVDLCDSINHCKRYFARKSNKEFTKDSADSFDRIVTSTFALMMSHFETFQKKQFAILVDSSYALKSVDAIELARRLEREGCQISLPRVLVGAGDYGDTGEIIADSMPGWHSAEKVNAYFRTLFPKLNIYSNEIVEELDVMWQIRHSIVHTAGIISKTDAIKVPGLSSIGGMRIKFGEEFMDAIGRRFHIMIESTLDRLRSVFVEDLRLSDNESEADRQDYIHVMVGYSSRRKSWFRGN